MLVRQLGGRGVQAVGGGGGGDGEGRRGAGAGGGETTPSLILESL